MKYLALDPGDTTGWAGFKENGDVDGFGDLFSKEDVYEMLNRNRPDVVICEDYFLYPWLAKEQSWSPFDTVRIIGAVEFWCWDNDKLLVLQKPDIKGIAYKWAGLVKPNNKKMTHQTDAYVHGVYYLQKNGIRKPQQGRTNAGS